MTGSTSPGDLRRGARHAAGVGIAANSLLFAVKGAIGLASGSLALVSDAVNSLVDVVASIGISYSVAVSHRAPDADHPFGHQRAEPLAALGVAIFTAIVGFSVGRAAVERLLEGPRPIRLAGWALAALVFSIAGNLILARYLRRRGDALDSPAILATAVESENDIGTSLAALVGVAAAALGWPVVDPIAGLVVGVWIIVGGARFGRRNIDYLMGKSPRSDLLARIDAAGREVGGVRGLHDVRAHHIGHRIHVEVHVEVDEELRTRQSHDLGGAVRHAIEALPGVDRAFVHLDPVLDSTRVIEMLARAERAASDVYAGVAGRSESPALAALWEALATTAQARAERLAVVRRLKGAGWHFADGELSLRRVEDRVARLEACRRRSGSEPVSTAAALDLALEVEGIEWRRDVRRATTPQDPTLSGSVEAAAPPPPSAALLLNRIAAARAESPDGALEDRLRSLADAVEAGAGA